LRLALPQPTKKIQEMIHKMRETTDTDVEKFQKENFIVLSFS